MLPISPLLPTWRRLAATAAFVALMAVNFFVGPAIEGRGIENVPFASLLLLMVPIGYLVALACEVAVRSGGWRHFRQRAATTALYIAGGFAFALTLDALITGGVSMGDVLNAAVFGGAFLLYVITTVKLAGG